MNKTYQLIGMVILAMAMPICLLANSEKDTTVYLSDHNGKAVTYKVSAYVARKWKEGNLWHVQNLYYPENTLALEGFFSDAECSKKVGLFVRYYANGIMQDSGKYVDNKQEGLHYSWFDTGELEGIEHYKNGHFVDSSINWNKNKTKSRTIFTDENGTGTEVDFNDSGTIRSNGQLYLGKKHSNWTYRDNNNIVSQIVKYESDSAITITNYSDKGIQEKGASFVEKGAEFPGGLNGWRSFLEDNLRYPQSCQRRGIQGVIRVQFTVGKDGAATEIKILGNPDKDLAKEAKRIMTKSPNWIPAIQYNRKVTYRFIQTITFQLQ